MGIRETINQKSKFTVWAIILIVAAAIGFCIWYLLPSARQANLAHEYFTDDDGKTWFTTDNADIPPFDHAGKQAVVAKVFRCLDGTTFVGYMEKFSDEAKKRMIEARASGRIKFGTGAIEPDNTPDLLVKKPHDKEWIDAHSPQAREVMKITCPDGGTDYEQLPPP